MRYVIADADSSADRTMVLEVLGAVLTARRSDYSSDMSSSDSSDSTSSESSDSSYSESKRSKRRYGSGFKGFNLTKAAWPAPPVSPPPPAPVDQARKQQVMELIVKAMIHQATVGSLQKRVEDRVDTVDLLEKRDWIDQLGSAGAYLAATPQAITAPSQIAVAPSQIVASQVAAGPSQVVAPHMVQQMMPSAPMGTATPQAVGQAGLVMKPGVAQGPQLVYRQALPTNQYVMGASQSIQPTTMLAATTALTDVNTYLKALLKQQIHHGYIQKAQLDCMREAAKLEGQNAVLRSKI
eukprot:Blabericola_migrator_1__7568@NODE_3868_length_1459_cov_12_849138_g2394_i0_p1_GENE_NODE_3868_length_1459_cov_12_849138_g2394_i0NODE_3868_length_1459_cov_12_849138_g2394_i0_p1_ORF_typecomplete_len295_score48_39Spore_II_R/PF09551_10/6_9Spore_II_R/PF09551_10/1_8e02Trimer_CC/PF08954_11/0_82Trimer_CC/PF08954_11/1_8e03DUF4614/PF15391_6/0_53DUF4614/PF15391_6/1_2e02_NODE_3868_length_1459_cov_12_849138_g2394_i05001384